MLHKDGEITMPILIGTYPYVKRNATKSCDDDGSSSVPYPKEGETHETQQLSSRNFIRIFVSDPPNYEEVADCGTPYRPVYHVYRHPVVEDH